jgi:hypothetical protein
MPTLRTHPIIGGFVGKGEHYLDGIRYVVKNKHDISTSRVVVIALATQSVYDEHDLTEFCWTNNDIKEHE